MAIQQLVAQVLPAGAMRAGMADRASTILSPSPL
jgi:hypothetical protein